MPLERFQEYEFGGVPTASSGGGSGEGGAVTSVNGKVGAVVIGKADVGLSQVDNTRDLDKPVSTATQQAIDEAVANIPSGGGGIEEAPKDSKTYGRNNGAWAEVTSGGDSYDDTEVRQLIAQNASDIEALESSKINTVTINGNSYNVGADGSVNLPVVDVTVTLSDGTTKNYKMVAVDG